MWLNIEPAGAIVNRFIEYPAVMAVTQCFS
jgi:hypothetical protein